MASGSGPAEGSCNVCRRLYSPPEDGRGRKRLGKSSGLAKCHGANERTFTGRTVGGNAPLMNGRICLHGPKLDALTLLGRYCDLPWQPPYCLHFLACLLGTLLRSNRIALASASTFSGAL